MPHKIDPNKKPSRQEELGSPLPPAPRYIETGKPPQPDPEAETPEAPAAPEAPDPAVQQAEDDSWAKVTSRLHDDLNWANPEPKQQEEQPAPPKPEKKEEPEPAPEPEKAEEPEAPAEEEKVEVETRPKISDIVKGLVDDTLAQQAMQENAPAVESVPGQPQADPDAAYVASLDEDERDLVDLATWAEDHGHPGLKKQFVEYFKAVDAFAAKRRQDDPDVDLEQDEAFRKFQKQNAVKLTPSQRRKLEMARVEERAEQRAAERIRKEIQPELEQVRTGLRAQQFKPELETEVVKERGLMLKQALGEKPEELPALKQVIDLVSEKGDQAEEEEPVLAPIVLEEQKAYEKRVAEYRAIERRAKQVDLNNPIHAELVRFIDEEGLKFKQNGGTNRIRTAPDGRRLTFVTNREWAQLIAAKSPTMANHWTFSGDEIVSVLRETTARRVKDRVMGMATRLTKGKYVKQTAPPAQDKANEARTREQQKAPAARSTPAPGAAAPAKPAKADTFFSESEWKARGLPEVA